MEKPKVSVVHFGPVFPFEIYMCEKNPREDVFTTNVFKQMTRQILEPHALFDAAGFNEYLRRREPNSPDVVMRNGDTNFGRHVILRYIINSTNETRASGLEALRAFLMSPAHSKFPPAAIDVEDLTNFDEENPWAMDQFLLNSDIDRLVRWTIGDDEWTNAFFEKFPECAKYMWSSQHVSNFGRNLGF